MHRRHPSAPVPPPLAPQIPALSPADAISSAATALCHDGLIHPEEEADPASRSLVGPTSSIVRTDPLPADSAAPSAASANSSGTAISPEIGETIGWLAGTAIALLSVATPLASVLLDRSLPPQLARPVPATGTPLQPMSRLNGDPASLALPAVEAAQQQGRLR